MNTKMKLISTVFAVLTSLAVAGQAAFQSTGWGARPVGMGGAFTSVGGDTNCMLYNPAGIASLEEIETNYMYSKLYSGLDTVNLGLNYFAFAYPFSENTGTFGLSWANMASDNEYSEDTITLSYARNVIAGKLDAGMNIKYLSHRYTLDVRTIDDPVFGGGNSKSAVSFDIGAIGTVPFIYKKDLNIGLAISDVNTPDVGLKSTDKVPMEARAGASCLITEDILASLDATYRMQEWGDMDDKMNIRLGGEAWFMDRVIAARAGANLNEFAVGFGFAPLLLAKCDMQLDYSFIFPITIKETAGSHRVSLIVRFLGKEKEKLVKKSEPKPEKKAELEPVKAQEKEAQAPKPEKSKKIRAVVPVE